jgi:hypothetical protein
MARMRMTNTERVTLHRQRLGQRPVQVLVSEQEVDFLLAHEYELSWSCWGHSSAIGMVSRIG